MTDAEFDFPAHMIILPSFPFPRQIKRSRAEPTPLPPPVRAAAARPAAHELEIPNQIDGGFRIPVPLPNPNPIAGGHGIRRWQQP
jgi:hypothetical protein